MVNITKVKVVNCVSLSIRYEIVYFINVSGTPADHRSSNHIGLPASSSENSLADRNGNPSLQVSLVVINFQVLFYCI